MSPILKALAEAEGKATKGPWKTLGGRVIQTAHVSRNIWEIPHRIDDAEFIALARNHMPALIEIARLAEAWLTAYDADFMSEETPREKLRSALSALDGEGK